MAAAKCENLHMDRPKFTALGAVVLLWTLWLVPTPVSASVGRSFARLETSTNASATRLAGVSNVAVKMLPMPNGGKSNVELSSVSCVDVHFCIAVGAFRPAERSMSYQGEQPVILRFDGKGWSLMRPPIVTEADLDGVDCLSTKYCVAVGESINPQEFASPLIEEMHGHVWSVTPSPSPGIYPTNSSQLQAVSCSAVGKCTAVGTDYGVGYPRGVSANTGIIEKETPTGWNLVQLAPLAPTLEPSAAGGTVVPATAFDPTMLVTVSCTSSLCVAAGEQRSFVERQGGTWTAIQHSPIITNGVTCRVTHQCLGVGSDGSIQSDNTDISTSSSIVRLAGTRWRRAPSPNTTSSVNTLNSVACGTADSCVAVGAFTGPPVDHPQSKQEGGALVEIESNGTWHTSIPPKTPADVDDSLASVSCPSSHMCVAVGQSVVNALRVPSGPVQSFSVLVRH